MSIVLATASSRRNDASMGTLPTETILDLIDEAAAVLDCSAEKVQETLDNLWQHDVTEAIAAMHVLHTCEASTLAAYMKGANVIDMNLDMELEGFDTWMSLVG